MRPAVPFTTQDVLSNLAPAVLESILLRAQPPAPTARYGSSLHAGAGTPLWNAIVDRAQPFLQAHGAKAELARLLGLHNREMTYYFTQRNRMADAERTLILLGWLETCEKLAASLGKKGGK